VFVNLCARQAARSAAPAQRRSQNGGPDKRLGGTESANIDHLRKKQELTTQKLASYQLVVALSTLYQNIDPWLKNEFVVGSSGSIQLDGYLSAAQVSKVI
jgi:hypothetical protein